MNADSFLGRIDFLWCILYDVGSDHVFWWCIMCVRQCKISSLRARVVTEWWSRFCSWLGYLWWSDHKKRFIFLREGINWEGVSWILAPVDMRERSADFYASVCVYFGNWFGICEISFLWNDCRDGWILELVRVGLLFSDSSRTVIDSLSVVISSQSFFHSSGKFHLLEHYFPFQLSDRFVLSLRIFSSDCNHYSLFRNHPFRRRSSHFRAEYWLEYYRWQID